MKKWHVCNDSDVKIGDKVKYTGRGRFDYDTAIGIVTYIHQYNCIRWVYVNGGNRAVRIKQVFTDDYKPISFD